MINKVNMFKSISEKTKEIKNKTENMIEEFIKVVGFQGAVKDSSGQEYKMLQEEQKEILIDMFKNVYFDGIRFFVLDNNFESKKFIEKDCLFFLKNSKYPNTSVFIQLKEEDSNRKAYKEIELVKITRALNVLKSMNQIEDISYKIDLFADKNNIERFGSRINIVKNSFSIKLPEIIEDDKQEFASELLEDYIKHNPIFERLPEMIVAPLFTEKRKEAVFYLRVPSNFGKSLLLGALTDLNMASKINYATVQSERGDVNPETLLNSICTFQDEVKTVPAALKDLDTKGKISPKGRMSVTVPFFSKFLLSAEVPQSLQDGVDEQFMNRIAYIDLSTCGDINKREMFTENSYLYMIAIQTYLYYMITNLIEEYKLLGKEEASSRASNFLSNFNKEYRISKTEELLPIIKEYINMRLVQILKKGNIMTHKMGTVTEKIFDIKHPIYERYLTAQYDMNTDDTIVYITSPKDFYGVLISEINREDTRKKYMYKASEYKEIFNGIEKNQVHPLLKMKGRFLTVVIPKESN